MDEGQETFTFSFIRKHSVPIVGSWIAGEAHWEVVKRVYRNLSGTRDFALTYITEGISTTCRGTQMQMGHHRSIAARSPGTASALQHRRRRSFVGLQEAGACYAV